MPENECENDQIRYNNWSTNTPVITVNRANAPSVNAKEREYIQKAKPSKILDIGCGNGTRLFSHLQRENIDFVGLEKFERLVDNREYAGNIIIEDLLEWNTEDYSAELTHVDVITIFGGSLLGIFCLKNQIRAWQKIHEILPENGRVIFDSLKVEGFETLDEIGTYTVHPVFTPPQYFLSESQLKEIWSNLGFEIIEYSDERVPVPFLIRYYLLQKK